MTKSCTPPTRGIRTHEFTGRSSDWGHLTYWCNTVQEQGTRADKENGCEHAPQNVCTTWSRLLCFASRLCLGLACLSSASAQEICKVGIAWQLQCTHFNTGNRTVGRHCFTTFTNFNNTKRQKQQSTHFIYCSAHTTSCHQQKEPRESQNSHLNNGGQQLLSRGKRSNCSDPNYFVLKEMIYTIWIID